MAAFSGVPRPLDCPISSEEVMRALRHRKRGKAPGPDGVTSNLLRGAEVSVVPVLVAAFNGMFERHEEIPSLARLLRAR